MTAIIINCRLRLLLFWCLENTLDNAKKYLRLKSLTDVPQQRNVHKFGDSEQEFPTLAALDFTFKWNFLARDEKLDKTTVHFSIKFDVIEGNLPFLIGLPTLKAMKANINLRYMYILWWKTTGPPNFWQLCPEHMVVIRAFLFPDRW